MHRLHPAPGPVVPRSYPHGHQYVESAGVGRVARHGRCRRTRHLEAHGLAIDFLKHVQYIASVEADFETVARVIDVDFLHSAPGFGAYGADRHRAVGEAQLYGAGLLGRDRGDAIDGARELLALEYGELLVSVRDHPLVIGERAVDQPRHQERAIERELDTGRGDADLDLTADAVDQPPHLGHGLAGDNDGRDLLGSGGP